MLIIAFVKYLLTTQLNTTEAGLVKAKQMI